MSRAAWLWLGLAGCGNVLTSTGPHGMEGHVLDSEGQPLEGLDVQTVESRGLTNEEGFFRVSFKAPTQWAHFDHEGVRWRRHYRPEDKGEVVRVQLPPTTGRAVRCLRAEACTARLRWALGDGLEAEATVTCDPAGEEPPILSAVPQGVPSEVTCRTGVTGVEAPAHVQLRGSRLTISPAPVPLHVRVDPGEGRDPTKCSVEIDEVLVQPGPDGLATREVSGDVELEPWCDGLPGVPKRVRVTQEGTTTVAWQGPGPTVDLSEVAPWATEVKLQARKDDRSLWILELQANEAHQITLPALPPGRYVLAMNLDDGRLERMGDRGQPEPGKLHFYELDESMRWTDGREAYAAFVVEETLDATPLPWNVRQKLDE